MMDMDEYWKKAEPIIDQKKERKLIYGSYAISFIMIAASILILFLMVLRHEEFTFRNLAFTVLMFIGGLSLSIFLFFRRKISYRCKIYLGCLISTFGSVFIVLHPQQTSIRHSNPTVNRMVGIAGCIFFGGGGLLLLYNDCKWYLYGKSKKADKQE